MDFEKVLPVIVEEFEESKIVYAACGGFALGLWGVIRATADLDFLLRASDHSKVQEILAKFGYKNVYKDENVSQFVSSLKIFGEIDFILAFRKYSRKMLARARRKEIFSGRLKVKVLAPEDVIGLKVQSLVNNPSRKHHEYADIESLMKKCGNVLDWGLIGEYFSLFGLSGQFGELKRKYG